MNAVCNGMGYTWVNEDAIMGDMPVNLKQENKKKFFKTLTKAVQLNPSPENIGVTIGATTSHTF